MTVIKLQIKRILHISSRILKNKQLYYTPTAIKKITKRNSLKQPENKRQIDFKGAMITM